MFRILKLRPPHGWAAVSWELAIVTLGVLIALVAQQWAENRAWAQKVDNAKSGLAEELGRHYNFAVEWRTVEPCIAAQLDLLDQRLMRSVSRNEAAPGQEVAGHVFVLRAPSRPYADSVWQGVIAEGVSSHLRPEERTEIGAYYRDVSDLDELNKQLVGASSRLNGLMRPMMLDPSTKHAMIQSIDETKDLNWWMGIYSGQLVDQIVKLKMAPAKERTRDFLATSGTRQFCAARGLPLRTFEEASKPIP